jgi:hypothetical protein
LLSGRSIYNDYVHPQHLTNLWRTDATLNGSYLVRDCFNIYGYVNASLINLYRSSGSGFVGSPFPSFDHRIRLFQNYCWENTINVIRGKMPGYFQSVEATRGVFKDNERNLIEDKNVVPFLISTQAGSGNIGEVWFSLDPNDWN